jgi:hypothetical protein
MWPRRRETVVIIAGVVLGGKWLVQQRLWVEISGTRIREEKRKG